MICCGDERDTPYCPQCGKFTFDEGCVKALTKYLESRASDDEKRARLLYESFELAPSKNFDALAKSKTVIRKSRKWRLWAYAVARLSAGTVADKPKPRPKEGPLEMAAAIRLYINSHILRGARPVSDPEMEGLISLCAQWWYVIKEQLRVQTLNAAKPRGHEAGDPV